MTPTLHLDGSPIHLADFVALAAGPVKISLSESIRRNLKQARAIVDRYAAGNSPVYGLNTGLGANLGHRIDEADIAGFQAQLLEGRMVGIGEPLSESMSRGALLARIIGASRGGSGLSDETFGAMIALAECGMAPVLPSIGSIGAGDLVLAAHMGGALIGHGSIWVDGEKVPAVQALAQAGLAPLVLKPKDALALANHSCISLAVAAFVAERARRGLTLSMAVAALSGEGYGINLSIFDERINALRHSCGQSEAAAWFRRAFEGSLLASPGSARSIQDALSFRTMASVFGAAIGSLRSLVQECENELNGIADNPVVLIQDLQNLIQGADGSAQPGEILSTANFHTPALSLALDSQAIAQAQLANCSAQRIVKLMMPNLTGLPKYLSPQGGASAGFVPLQKTVAALLADIRLRAHPASIDAMPVSDGVEDVAPQTLLAGMKLQKQLESLSYLTSIEALVAAQAVDLRSPGQIGDVPSDIHACVRSAASMLKRDRPSGNEIEDVRAALAQLDMTGLCIC